MITLKEESMITLKEECLNANVLAISQELNLLEWFYDIILNHLFCFEPFT